MATTFATPRMARSKSGADLLYDKIKQEQYLVEEKQAIEYLNSALDISISYDAQLHHELKDGVLLCNLINKLKPGTIKQVGQKDLSFIQMDNITRFLQGARQLGLNESQLFETTDLFEARDMTAVIHTILAISRLTEEQILNAQKKPAIKPAIEKPITPPNDTTPTDQDDINTKYRDVRDIFGGYSNKQNNNNNNNNNSVNLNREAILNSKKLSRPPKSPLRSPEKTNYSRYSVDHLPSLMNKKKTSLIARSHSSISQSDLTPTASHTFPKKISNSNSSNSLKKQEQILLSKNPTDSLENQEKLLSYSKDGETITQYQLGNCIGKGQFGSVYRALDLATGEIVAVKKLCLEEGVDIDQEIMKEVALLKTLSHTNVIRYLGFIQCKHSINIILEYAENGSLMSTLKAFGAFPEKLVASFSIKILNGLEYLHENQVVHCDLKAANILTTKTGDVKLTDFGVSLNLKIKGADAGAVSGTPNWMAPEVIELKGASTKSDIWSLGCTLVELVTGKPPYADMIAMSAMFRIVEDQCPPLPEHISDEMKSFLEACFQKDPEARPSATQLKQHPWIVEHQQRIKKTETYPHDLSTYLRQKRQESDDEEDFEKTLKNSTVDEFLVNPNESQLTLYDESDHVEHLKIGLRNEEDYITHRFIHTSFGKVVECKVCNELMNTEAIFCQVCALICHEDCKKSAFSCPPKVNDQQPSYDWVFSAKVYNKKRNHKTKDLKRNTLRRSQPVQLKPEDAESIRQYTIALGLTEQEEEALKRNQALLSHTLSLQQQHKIDPGTMRHKATSIKSSVSNKEENKKKKHGRRTSEECIIS